MTRVSDEQAILAEERRALDRWAQGQPSGYVTTDADEVTYFDDIGAQKRVDGIAALRRYLSTLEGKIPSHRYELVNPKVQLYGDVGVLTLRYEPSAAGGKPLTPWKATLVYRRIGAEWRRVHGHWSMAKEA